MMIRSSKSNICISGHWINPKFHVYHHRKYFIKMYALMSPDLPSLQTIELGNCALTGINRPSCSLTMRSMSIFNGKNLDLPNELSIISNLWNFYEIRLITLESIFIGDSILLLFRYS